MKTLLSLLVLFLTGSFVTSCSKSEPEKFEARFTGEYVEIITDRARMECDQEYECRVIVTFTGTATHIGDISGRFSFCACGPDGQYAPTESYFVASEGDTLFFSCQGRVIEGRLPTHPEFVTSYWKDPFVLIGGTGKFEGATGGGTTDDYNSSEDPNSHHHWKGTITLKN